MELTKITGELADGFEELTKAAKIEELEQRKINDEVYQIITEIRNIGQSALARPGFPFLSDIRKFLKPKN